MRVCNFATHPLHTLLLGILSLILLKSNSLHVMAFSTPSPQVPQHLATSSSSVSPNQATEGSPYNNPKLFQAYEQSMHEVLDSFKILKAKDSQEDLEAAKRFLFSSNRFISITPSPTNEKEEFKEHVNLQREHFSEKTEFKKNQKELILRALTYIGDYCAKKGSSAPLHVAWDKMKEAGLIPRQNALGAYLYIMSSLPSILDSDSDTVEEFPSMDSYNPSNIAGEVAFYHDMLYKPTENTVTIRIKSLVEQGHATEAEKLLWNLESSASESAAKNDGGKKKKENDNGKLRLRTCVPVLQLYCEEGDVSCGLKLYQKMREAPSVHFEPETYALMLSSLAKWGYFCSESEAIEGFEAFGYEAGKGASLFDAIVSEMADDVLEITSASAKEIRNALVAGFGTSKMSRNLYEVPYDCDLAAVNNEAADDELVANRVTIDSNSTICSRTKAELRLILLEENQKKHVHDTLLEMADTQFEAYETKLQKKGNKPSTLEENYAGKHLQGFANWLNDREGKPFTAIVDGANVAYYGIGCINYHQIKLMVVALEKMGETPLVVMPQKYAQKKFHLRQGYVQELPQSQIDILEELEEAGKFYKVPARCLDDYYWMLSSVSNQKTSRDGNNLDVATDNEESRWPGTRPMLLTNDQMRDHRLELLEPRLFRRWVSSHIVNYHFPPFLNDAWEDREITFTPADFTSREIQGNPSNSAMAWHFPVKDWDKNDRFCVRIPEAS